MASSFYHEVCKCGHTRYLHCWLPDADKPLSETNPKHDCQTCDCKAFSSSGRFSFDLEPSTAETSE